MEVVNIGGTDYDSYASLDQANAYLAASVNTEAWDAEDDTGKSQLLVTATRILQRQVFATTPTDLVLREATIEYANAIANDPDVASASSTETTLKRLKASTVEIENFRSVDTFSSVSRFPQAVMDLLKLYLGSFSVSGGSFASDVSNCSDFEDSDRPTFNEGI